MFAPSLIAAAAGRRWRKRTSNLFRDIIILMRDTGMRNQRELYRMRIENLDWENRLMFVPDSKTPEGRRVSVRGPGVTMDLVGPSESEARA